MSRSLGSAGTRLRIRQLAAVIAAACVVTPLFNVTTNVPTLRAAVQGLVDGVVVTVLVGGFLLFVRDGWLRPWFTRLGFAMDLLVSSGIATGLFLVGRALGQVITQLDPGRFAASFSDAHLRVALPFFAALSITIQFLLQMNRMIGASILRYFIAGVYHRPKLEERIFLFVDLEGSTVIAERLGSARYFDLLRSFVDDLTEPILETEGEIYQYAGDEVVVTWPLASGVRAANCVRCYFGIVAALARETARYQREFGTTPRVRAGLHGGLVTAGELGDLRRQIVFVGDILNTAARLEEHAKRSGLDLVASEAVVSRLALPPGVEARQCGELELRGKQQRVTAYGLSGAIRRGPVATPP